MDMDAPAHLAITRIQGRYADIATRRAWAELADLTLSDARFSFELPTGHVLELVGPGALADFGARATARFSFYEYVPLNTVATVVNETTAAGRSYSLEIGVDATSGAWTEFYGRYDDEYARTGRGWQFARRAFRILTTRTRGGGLA